MDSKYYTWIHKEANSFTIKFEDEKYTAINERFYHFRAAQIPELVFHLTSGLMGWGGQYDSIITYYDLDEESFTDGSGFPEGYFKVVNIYTDGCLIEEKEFYKIIIECVTKLFDSKPDIPSIDTEYYRDLTYLKQKLPVIDELKHVSIVKYYKNLHTIIQALNPDWLSAIRESVNRMNKRIQELEK